MIIGSKSKIVFAFLKISRFLNKISKLDWFEIAYLQHLALSYMCDLRMLIL